MNQNKLFVGGIPYSTTKEELEELFGQFGQIISVYIAMDKMTGRSKGFAFVEFSSDAEADAAVKGLDNSDMGGRSIKVSVARPREENNNFGPRN